MGLTAPTSGPPRIAAATQNFPEVTKYISAWIATNNDISEQTGYTSMAMNYNFASKRHRDANKEGLSIAIRLCDYTGELLTWP